jgi:UDP-2,3-diacylglucosamine pyrophosphatase LpxH
MIEVTSHARERMKERCKLKAKSTERIARIAYEKGLKPDDFSGSLHGYLVSLYEYNGKANNIKLYGDKIYIFCGDVLVTVYDTPKRFRNTVNNLMRKRREYGITK